MKFGKIISGILGATIGFVIALVVMVFVGVIRPQPEGFNANILRNNPEYYVFLDCQKYYLDGEACLQAKIKVPLFLYEKNIYQASVEFHSGLDTWVIDRHYVIVNPQDDTVIVGYLQQDAELQEGDKLILEYKIQRKS